MSLTVLALIPLSADPALDAMGASALQDIERSAPFVRTGYSHPRRSSDLIESACQTRFWWNLHVGDDARACADLHSPELYITYV